MVIEHRDYNKGKCPNCRSENVSYGSLEPEDGEKISYTFTCEDCGKAGKEWYSLKNGIHWNT